MFSVAGAFQGISLFSRLTKKGGATDQSAQFARRKDVQGEVSFFREKIKTIRTPQEFLNNPRLMQFALTAFGLGGEKIPKANLDRAMMTDGANLNSGIDPRVRDMITGFDFFRSGVEKLSDPAFVDKVVRQYVENGAEKNAANGSTDVANALYFRRRAASITNISEIVADPVLLQVAVDSLGMSGEAVKKMSLPQIHAAIAKGVDVSKLKDQAFVDSFIKRGLVRKEMAEFRASRNSLVDFLA